MTWIAERKSKGKFIGLISGGFLAFAWGHWHDRIFANFGIRCSRLYTQAAIIAVSILIYRAPWPSQIICLPRTDTVQINFMPTSLCLTTICL